MSPLLSVVPLTLIVVEPSMPPALSTNPPDGVVDIAAPSAAAI